MEERRSSQRFSVALDAHLSLVDHTDPKMQCSVVELNMLGVGIRLHVRKHVEFGQKLLLSIPLPEKNEPLNATVTVRWKKRLSGGEGYQHMIGGDLAISDPRSLKMLFDHLQPQNMPKDA